MCVLLTGIENHKPQTDGSWLKFYLNGCFAHESTSLATLYTISELTG